MAELSRTLCGIIMKKHDWSDMLIKDIGRMYNSLHAATKRKVTTLSSREATTLMSLGFMGQIN